MPSSRGVHDSVIVALAMVGERFVAMSHALRAIPGVVEARSASHLRDYQLSGPSIEFYAECGTKSGRDFSWVLDVTREGVGWTVDRRVYEHFSEGAQTLLQLADRCFDDEAALARELVAPADELLAVTLERCGVDPTAGVGHAGEGNGGKTR